MVQNSKNDTYSKKYEMWERFYTLFMIHKVRHYGKWKYTFKKYFLEDEKDFTWGEDISKILLKIITKKKTFRVKKSKFINSNVTILRL